jgi:hypothetical protein
VGQHPQVGVDAAGVGNRDVRARRAGQRVPDQLRLTTSGDLFRLVNQLEGVKMLALAVTAACIAAMGRPGPALPAGCA